MLHQPVLRSIVVMAALVNFVAVTIGTQGGLLVAIGFTFAFTPLGHAERYIPLAEAGQ